MATIPNPIGQEEASSAAQAIIEHGPWAAAAVLVFLAFTGLGWWVLRTAIKEMRTAREQLASANERYAQVSTKIAETNTRMVERLDSMMKMLDRVLDLLHDSARRGG